MANYNKSIPIEHIRAVLSMHHWECVFEIDAPRRIYDRLKHHSHAYWLNYRGPDHTKNYLEKRRRLDEFRNAFIQSEIYCPHEGVDRRSEYGMA
jgi:hypothetical protein